MDFIKYLRFVLSALVLFVLSFNVSAQQTVAGKPPDPAAKATQDKAYRADRIIVKYKKNALTVDSSVVATAQSGGAVPAKHFHGKKSLDALHVRHGIKGMRKAFRQHGNAQNRTSRLTAAQAAKADEFMKQDVYVLEMGAGTDVQQAVDDFKKDPDVEYAQPDYVATVNMVPNDPYFSSSRSWGQSYDDLWGIKKMNVPAAWDSTQGEGVIVAVVDTGVDYHHPDIAANMVAGWNFVTDTSDSMDKIGHGTHVAGTIAAVGNNSLGVIGVAPKAKIMPLKGFDDEGNGSMSDLADAIIYAAQHGAKVINNSWGCSSSCLSNPLAEAAVRQAEDLGAVVVFSAGNSNLDVVLKSPQNMTDHKPLVVAASCPDDTRAYFSDYGDLVDVTAPGSGLSADIRGILSLKATTCSMCASSPDLIVNQNYFRTAGTSMAAPHVSGLAALIIAKRPSLTAGEVKNRIKSSATSVPGLPGAGMVNALAATSDLIVNAGPDLRALVNTPLSLTGTLISNNLPSTTVNWLMYAGPSAVSFTNKTSLNTDVTFPALGVYTLRLTANNGGLSAYDEIKVTVMSSGHNNAPLVYAGRTDFTTTVNTPDVLIGTVIDDGLPVNKTMTVNWVKYAGPAEVSFTAQTSKSTLVTFSVPGVYILRLNANDGELTAYDEVTVTVTPVNKAPVVAAGPDLTATVYTPLALTGTVTDDGLPLMSALDIFWTKDTGPASASFSAQVSLNTNVIFTVPGVYTLRLNANDGVLRAYDEITVTVKPSFNNKVPIVLVYPEETVAVNTPLHLVGQVIDDGSTVVNWVQYAGPAAVSFTNPTGLYTNVTFPALGVYTLRLNANDGILTAYGEIKVTVTPPNKAPVVAAGPDLTATVYTPLALTGTVTDDGLPLGRTLSISWWPVTGPTSSVGITQNNSVNNEALFTTPGVYTLKLQAYDGELSATDEITVTVTLPVYNKEPVVSAGPDLTTIVNTPLALTGTVTDDGLPAGKTLTVNWVNYAGPAAASFTAQTNRNTNVIFPVAGVYTLRFYANDGELTSYDEMIVTVKPPTNKAPVVFAGPDLTATVNTPLALTGTVTDDGLPAGKTLTVNWVNYAGPAAASFTAQTSRNASVRFSVAGVYTLRFYANDGELTAYDEITVMVKPLNKAPVVSTGPDLTATINTPLALTGTVTDDGLPAGQTMTVNWGSSGPAKALFTPTMGANTKVTFTVGGEYCLRLYASDGELTGYDEIIVKVTGGVVNKPPVVSAGPDLTATVNTPLALTGTVTDDGLPVGKTLSASWWAWTGPAQVTIPNQSWGNNAYAIFHAPGVYTLRLIAYDGYFDAYDEVTVTVKPLIDNKAPVVSAGPDLTATVNTPLALTGTVTDDGLPAGKTMSIYWIEVFAPGRVLYSNQGLNARVTFPVAGLYKLRLVANDGALVSYDDILVTVTAPAPVNKAPVVSAGPDLTAKVNIPLALAGIVTDDGLPAGKTMSIYWIEVFAPGRVLYSNQGLNARVTFPVAGLYKLRLVANDGALVSYDDILVTVKR